MDDGKPPDIESSSVGTVGKAIEPVIQPLGFNWKIGVGLITSLAAREVIVGTLGTFMGWRALRIQRVTSCPRKDLPLPAPSRLLIFFAFAMQCFSTIAVVRRETGGWKWPAIQFAYMTALAYFGALAANQIITRLSA